MPSTKSDRPTAGGRRARRDPRALSLAQTRRQHAREMAEDYAEAIAELIADRGEARVVELAARLGVTHVTVHRTIARLQKAGLVISRPYRAIGLTRRGRVLAATSRSRHETVLRYLLSLGIPEHVASIDAEGIEHHVSPETLAAFAAALHDAVPRGTPEPRGRNDAARLPRMHALRER